MCSIVELFNDFSQSFIGKSRCIECENDCSGFCVTKCLVYENYKLPDYSCAFLRDAYVLKYLPAHKAELRKLYYYNTEEIMNHVPMINRKEPVTVLSLGAGPDTDLIAFAEWLQSAEARIERPLVIQFIRVDTNDDWKSQYHRVRAVFKTLFGSLKSSFDHKDLISDVFDIKNMPEEVHFTSASYLLSELWSKYSSKDCNEKIYNFWVSFKDNASSKSIILLNDRPEAAVRDLAKQLISFIITDYPRIHFKQFCFKDCCLDDPEITVHAENWCGCHLPTDLRDKYQSKTTCASYQCIIFIDKN